MPAPSPDGKRIAFESDRSGVEQVWVIPANGGSATAVTDFGPGAEEPAWSPDGRLIVFNSNIEQPNGRIWTVDVHGHAKQLTFGPRGMEDFEPTYSPDGKYVAFSRYQDDPDHTDIWVVRADGTGAHDLAPGADGFDVGATWAVAVRGRCS